jgi:hypothetical protein
MHTILWAGVECHVDVMEEQREARRVLGNVLERKSWLHVIAEASIARRNDTPVLERIGLDH